MADYFITGASSGIGRALAQEVCRHKNRVWGVARRKDRLVELADELGHERFLFSVCDVSRAEDVRSTAQAMERSRFHPDVVILNAGVAPEPPGSTFSLEDFEKAMRVNLFGALAWVEVFLPTFRIQGRGQFVAISSTAAFRGYGRRPAYCASKAGLSRAFEALRGRYTRDGVVFTTIHLGLTDTGMGKKVYTPLRLKEDQAVRLILAAIDRHAHSVTIPRLSRLVIELLRVVPDPLLSWFVERMVTESKDEGTAPAIVSTPKREDK